MTGTRGPTSAGRWGRRWPRAEPTVGSCAAGRAPACRWLRTRSQACGPRCARTRRPHAGARRWNDANVLALGLRLTSDTVADEVVDAFLTTDVDPSERGLIDRLS